MKRDIPFKFDQSSDLGRWRAETFWEKEPETIAWAESFYQLEQRNLDFIDVGANLGIYSLFALSTGFYKRVIAIEPMPLNFRQLEKNIAMNNFEEKVVLYNQPLYSHSVLTRFEFSDERIGSSGGQVIEKDSSPLANGESLVQCLTGDEIVESNFVKSCVIKLDVDGLELEILKGFKNALTSGIVRSVLVEATIHNIESIIGLMEKYSFFLDTRFDSTENHSSKRRVLSGSAERNLIFSKLTID
jgi:FkbM family methyltransferase